MFKGFKFTIPNLLSLYRLFAFPFILGMVILKWEVLFAIFICISLVTDILDGWIARQFNQKTEYGAKLDSIADMTTYFLGFIGLFVFKWSDIEPYKYPLFLFIFLFLVCYFFSLIKFGRFPSLHLYSWKIGGYIQGLFFFTLFAIGFYEWFYFLMVYWGILAFIEHLTIQLLIKEMRINAKGLYWVLKSQK